METQQEEKKALSASEVEVILATEPDMSALLVLSGRYFKDEGWQERRRVVNLIGEQILAKIESGQCSTEDVDRGIIFISESCDGQLRSIDGIRKYYALASSAKLKNRLGWELYEIVYASRASFEVCMEIIRDLAKHDTDQVLASKAKDLSYGEN